MSNDWFAGFSRLAKGSKARADAVNALFDDIVTGMDKMPTEIQMNSGTRNFAADTGAVNAYACALSHVANPIDDGQHVVLFVDAADVNTSTGVTLNVNAVGNVAVKFPDGENPAIGDIIGMCEFRYSNTDSVWHFVTTSLARVTAAAASAAEAATSESNASTSESNASTSESNAATSESNSANSASSSEDSKTYSAEWANKAEDSLVSAAAGGDQVDDYSALHWAAKAASSAAGILSGNNTFTGINTFTKIQKIAKGADIASAAALTLGTDGNYFDITGTTAITSINTADIGSVIKLHFDGILTLTHHATDLILPGGANIVTAAGDEAEFVEYAAGDWRCVNYQRAANAPTLNAGLNTKVMDIGDWDMDTNQSVSVAHGLTFSKIRNVSALIRHDTDGVYSFGGALDSTETDESYIYAGPTDIVLRRGAGGWFDRTEFNATSYNRGWITIQYVD